MKKGKGHARVYPFTGDETLRDAADFEKCALEAEETGVPKDGIKGISVVLELDHFDMVNGFVPDFLHACLLGVAKQVIGLWFDSSNSEKPWYIGKPAQQDIISQNIIHCVTVPKEVRRLPRSLKHRKEFKGNEFKTFTLYISLGVLKDTLPKKYLSHWFL